MLKFAIPVGLAVLSHQALIGIAKFAKVGSVGILELLVPVLTFAGCLTLMNRLKKNLKTQKQSQQLLIAPPDYSCDYQSGQEFIVRERGIKKETFSNGEKITVYEFERRSSTW